MRKNTSRGNYERRRLRMWGSRDAELSRYFKAPPFPLATRLLTRDSLNFRSNFFLEQVRWSYLILSLTEKRLKKPDKGILCLFLFGLLLEHVQASVLEQVWSSVFRLRSIFIFRLSSISIFRASSVFIIRASFIFVLRAS